MSAQHVITAVGDRITIECQSCKDSMTVGANSMWGSEMVKNWPKLHKCYKAAKK